MSHAFNFKDITGQKFHRLQVIGFAGIGKENRAMWECQCECGNIVIVAGKNLRNGSTKSCGCYNIDAIKARNTIVHGTHLETHTKLFHVWSGMLSRCNNPNFISYKHYGGKGIRVCKEWEKDFAKFKEWAIANGYQEDLTIDRIDYNGNYEPSNCRWCTLKEQARNRSSNKLITYNGETHCLADWADILGMNYNLLLSRIRSNKYSIEEAFTKPPRSRTNFSNEVLTFQGESHTLHEWSALTNTSVRTLQTRIKKNLPIEEILKPKVQKNGDDGLLC